jgi:hypothetical protein
MTSEEMRRALGNIAAQVEASSRAYDMVNSTQFLDNVLRANEVLQSLQLGVAYRSSLEAWQNVGIADFIKQTEMSAAWLGQLESIAPSITAESIAALTRSISVGELDRVVPTLGAADVERAVQGAQQFLSELQPVEGQFTLDAVLVDEEQGGPTEESDSIVQAIRQLTEAVRKSGQRTLSLMLLIWLVDKLLERPELWLYVGADALQAMGELLKAIGGG